MGEGMALVKIAEIVNVVIPIILALGFAGIIIYRTLKKKGLLKSKSKKEESEIDVRKISKKSVREFNPVEDIRENYIITEAGSKFTVGLLVQGVSFDKLSLIEKNIIETNYIGLYNMVDWELQYYIQSRLMDVDSNIKFLDESKGKITAEYNKAINEKAKIANVIATTPSRADGYRTEFEKINIIIDMLSWQIQHKDEEIAYALAISSPSSQPQYDMYILLSYEYDASLFSTELTSDEIYGKAKDDLETKLANIIAILKRCMVDSTILTKEQAAEMLYRAFNLSDADTVKFKELFKTSSFDMYTTTDYFEISKLQYAAATIKQSIDNDIGGVA